MKMPNFLVSPLAFFNTPSDSKKHRDMKRLNMLRLDIENMNKAIAKNFMANTSGREYLTLSKLVARAKAEIEEIESKYPDWK
jgi:hypothetical protein